MRRSLLRLVSIFLAFPRLLLLGIWGAETVSFMLAVGAVSVHPLVDIFAALILHVFAAAAVSFGLFGTWDLRTERDRNWAMMGFTLVLCVPYYGLVGFTALHVALRGVKQREGGLLSEFEKYISYEESAADAARRPGAIPAVAGGLDVAPLGDVLAGDDNETRRAAVRSMGHLAPPVAVRLLREALSDPFRDVRFLAANELSKIEQRFMDRIMQAQKAIAADASSAEARMALARACHEYVTCGLLDESSGVYFGRVAEEALHAALRLHEDDPEALGMIADLRRREGDLEGALLLFDRVAGLLPGDLDTRVKAADIAFEQGDVASAASRVQEIMAMPGGPEAVGHVAEFLYGAAGPQGPAEEVAQSAIPTLTAIPAPGGAAGDGEASA